ncbi:MULTISPECIES: hypothetical protein [Enterobacteriaceae]|nr:MULTISPECIES: hypothetical protein [Enterobacteriaceae]MDK3490804.1 hypothetical protein [Escherichia coli]
MNETEDIRTDYDLVPFKQTEIAITAKKVKTNTQFDGIAYKPFIIL